jgi:hypothetical protein
MRDPPKVSWPSTRLGAGQLCTGSNWFDIWGTPENHQGQPGEMRKVALARLKTGAASFMQALLDEEATVVAASNYRPSELGGRDRVREQPSDPS